MVLVVLLLVVLLLLWGLGLWRLGILLCPASCVFGVVFGVCLVGHGRVKWVCGDRRCRMALALEEAAEMQRARLRHVVGSQVGR